MEERARLRRTILDLHGCDSFHVRSERVHEAVEGTTVWEGVVEVFALKGHPKASLAYAWGQPADDGGRTYVAVLGVPPIRCAADAVRAAIAAQLEARGGRR
jgi:hypothetical protein